MEASVRGGPSAGRIEAVQDITFRFHDDQLLSVTVVCGARLVEGLSNMDIIDAMSAVYGPATLTTAASKGPARRFLDDQQRHGARTLAEHRPRVALMRR